MSYYKQINGVRYDRALLEKAAELQEGQGDGRISRPDAVELAEEVNDGGTRTKVEDKTVRKIYREANFTEAGRDEFEYQNRSAGAKRGWETRRANELGAEDHQEQVVQGQASQLAMRVQQAK